MNEKNFVKVEYPLKQGLKLKVLSKYIVSSPMLK